MVGEVARSNRLTATVLAASMVMASALLAGCGAAPFALQLDGEGPRGEPTPHATETPSNAPTDDAADDGHGNADAPPSAAATCLIGLWQEDMKIYTDTLKMSMGTFDDGRRPSNVTWTGDAYLRFNDKNRFSLRTEDLSVSFEFDGVATRNALDSNGGGGYRVVGDEIRWASQTTVTSSLRVFEDGKLVEKSTDGGYADFSVPSPFTCANDTLEVKLDGDRQSPPRVFQRSTYRGP